MDVICPYELKFNKGDAGLDLRSSLGCLLEVLKPTLIPLGIAAAIPEGYVAILKDRSGLASKGIHVIGGVIDSSYRGEWKAILIALNKSYLVVPGERVCQAIFIKYNHYEINEVDTLDTTDRGEAGFGSTGTL